MLKWIQIETEAPLRTFSTLYAARMGQMSKRALTRSVDDHSACRRSASVSLAVAVFIASYMISNKGGLSELFASRN
jgi:hypothetical protein